MKPNVCHRESTLQSRSTSAAKIPNLSTRMSTSAIVFTTLFMVGNTHAKDPGTPTAEHLGLTPAYLAGEWCNTHIQFPTSLSPENRLHRFGKDGSFAAQTAPASNMKPGLVYRYRPQGRVGMDGLLYKVKSVKPDEFILHIAVNDLHFRRGPCK